jgi:hypothetical protein
MITREINIPKQSPESVYILVSWILMWCFTLSFQDANERTFRMNQLRQVLAKLSSDFNMPLGSDLFYLLM